jgi:ribosomal protein L32
MPRIALALYRPDHLCPRCGAEGARPNCHRAPVLVVFGGGPQWPCAGLDGSLGEHFCSRCENCGHAWMEAVVPGSVTME